MKLLSSLVVHKREREKEGETTRERDGWKRRDRDNEEEKGEHKYFIDKSLA